MFGLSLKDEEELTPPEVVYDSEAEEAEGTEGSAEKSSGYPDPKSGGDAGSDR
jgi:hypothetical protein